MLLPALALVAAVFSEQDTSRARAQELEGRLGLRGRRATVRGLAGRILWVEKTFGLLAAWSVAEALQRLTPAGSPPWQRRSDGLPMPPPGLRLPRYEPLIPLLGRDGMSRENDVVLVAQIAPDIGQAWSRELPTVADYWSRAEGPRPRSWSEAVEAARVWHAEQFAKPLTFRQPVRHRGIVLMRDRHGGTVERLITCGALADEGNSMGHCIGRLHQEEVLGGDEIAFSYRDARGKPQATWTMYPFGAAEGGDVAGVPVIRQDVSLDEVQGPQNTYPTDEPALYAMSAFMMLLDGEDGVEELDEHVEFPLGVDRIIKNLSRGGLQAYQLAPHFEWLVKARPEDAVALSRALRLEGAPGPDWSHDRELALAKMTKAFEEERIDFVHDGEMPDVAPWVDAGISPEEAVQWAAEKHGPEYAAAFIDADYPFEDAKGPLWGDVSAMDMVEHFKLPLDQLQALGDTYERIGSELADLVTLRRVNAIDVSHMVATWLTEIPYGLTDARWIEVWGRHAGLLDEKDILDLMTTSNIDASELAQWLDDDDIAPYIEQPYSRFIERWTAVSGRPSSWRYNEEDAPGAWLRADIPAEEAHLWREIRVFAPEAAEWRQLGLSPEQVDPWALKGLKPDEAEEWLSEGYTPAQALRYIEQGISSPADLE